MTVRRYRVRGRVQGVGFRAFALRAGRALGLAGGVRNEADGSVTAVAEGADDALDALAGRLAAGPPAARVDGVEEETLAALPVERFDLRY
jgi:acylphosphatase